MADTPIREELAADQPLPGGVSERSVLAISYRFIHDLIMSGPEDVRGLDKTQAIYTLSLLLGYVSRLEAENEVIRELLSTAVAVRTDGRHDAQG